MLAGICHEEFYRYSDQEVSNISPVSFPSAFHLVLLSSSPASSHSLYSVHFSFPRFIFRGHLHLQAFAIFITHTSFRLYYAFFPQTYLQSLHDTGSVHQGIQLSASKLYDICDPDQRCQWLDVLIAMVEYLRSGESKVGHLNNSVEKNMLHKDNEVQFDKSVARDQRSGEGYAGCG